jgi:hypothetical protein
VTSYDADSQPAPDEHQRFAHYLQQLAAVREADEADLVATVLRDPDQAMAQSAVARHLDNRAAHLLPLPDQRYEDWARAIADQISELAFLTRRLHEWTLLRSITVGKPWAPTELATASDWFQRKAAETITSPAALTLLASAGKHGASAPPPAAGCVGKTDNPADLIHRHPIFLRCQAAGADSCGAAIRKVGQDAFRGHQRAASASSVGAGGAGISSRYQDRSL